MKLIYLPFENLPQRYTKMWNDSFIAQMKENDICVFLDEEEKKIKKGEFLDISGTIIHKSEQIKKVAELFDKEIIKDGDVFFVPDIFFPAIEGIRYMAELSNISVKIVAFNHAGRADSTDYVQRLGNWADVQEKAWHDVCDLVLVGSKYHAEKIKNKFYIEPIVTGAIWSNAWMNRYKNLKNTNKEEFVIFPHRLSKEKGVEDFIEIANKNKRLQFVVTSSGNPKEIQLPNNVKYLPNLTKKEYYEVFSKARYYLSTAYQETFGYTLQEAIYFGCKIIAPNDLSYIEYADARCLMEREEMKKENAITNKFAEIKAEWNTNIEDNASKIYKICTT